MATDAHRSFFRRFSPTPHQGAQCPSCFTFNLLHHLPDNLKQRHAGGLELTCALCGTQYAIEKSSPDTDILSMHEKGAA